MSLYSIPPLISSILFFLLGLFCYLKNKQSKVNISFALMCLTIVWWQGSWTVLFNVKDPKIASILVRFGYSGIIFLPVTLYHFIIEFLNRKEEKILIQWSYIIGVGFLISLWTTNLFINGYYTYYWGYYPKASFILHPVYLTVLSVQVLRILYLLYIYLKKPGLGSIKCNQIKYMFWGIFFYTFAAADFADNYGLEFYPLGFIPVSIFSAILGHSIVKYRLLDIHFVIKKAIAFIWIVLLVTISIVFIYVLPFSQIIKLFLYITTTSIYAIFSMKIIPKAEIAVNNILFREKYKYHDRLEDLPDEMKSIRKEEKLFKHVAKTLSLELKTKKATIFIFDHVSHDYTLKAQIGLETTGDLKIPGNTGLAPWLRNNRETFIKEEQKGLLKQKEFEPINEILDKTGAVICVPIIFRKDLVGIITLGEKESGDMYSHIDLKILHHIGTELGDTLYIRHIEQKERKEETFYDIGVMSHELAHEISNKLVSAKTFIDLVPTRKDDDEFLKDFGGLADKELDIVKTILDKIRIFGSSEAIKYNPADLKEVIEHILTENEEKIKNNKIQIVREISGIPYVNCGRNEIKIAIENIVKNGIDSMETKPGGKLRIRMYVNNQPNAEMKDVSDKWVRVEIKDDGVGIPDRIMGKLYTAFMTTKSGGHVKSWGSGLGMPIARRIIDKHKGEIHIDSKINKGTTVVIDIPADPKDKSLPGDMDDWYFGMPSWKKDM